MANGSKDAAIDAAVAAAAAPGATTSSAPAANTPTTNPDAVNTPAATPAGDNTGSPAAATEPAAPPASTNLNSAVVNVGVDGIVEQFNAQDLDINSALHFLSLQSHRNIIASKDVKGTVTANLYNVTFQEALDALLKPNGFDYIEKGNFIYVYTTKELEEIRKRDRHTANRIFRLHYVNAADALALIKPMLSSSGTTALTPAEISGLPTGATDTGGMNNADDDTLVINDFPENLSDIEHALKDIDVRPKQVLIESTILNAQLTDQNALGVDFVSLSGVNFANLLTGGLTNNSSASSGSSSSSSSGSTISGPNSIANTFTTATQGHVSTDFASQVPSGGLSVGFLSNNFSFFVRALESVTDTTVIANPKILALNKQKGEVHIGGELGYITTTTSTTTSQQTVQFIDTGTKLIFRPFIGDDGYVRMEIHPEESTGSIDAKGVPQTNTTEVTSNVMVKDGRTVVIGGLFSEATTASRGQVPIIGNIPILGVPFRQTNDNTVRTETIILITPHIINDDTALYEESQKESEDVTRMMLGARSGLQPWGRDRIAQFWYSRARDSADKGDKEKATMYTDWALNTNPRFIEAIKLREQLTNQRVEEAAEGSIPNFVRNVIGDDKNSIPDTGSSAHYPAAPATTMPDQVTK
ncbi:MAG TPA: secretin and TonB N-terminal domain-containing protein [Phycisphaerae bacterium]|nr:secretin and TonB N-terminal domain-containing protein [Phycisphaerae bacterium]